MLFLAINEKKSCLSLKPLLIGGERPIRPAGRDGSRNLVVLIFDNETHYPPHPCDSDRPHGPQAVS